MFLYKYIKDGVKIENNKEKYECSQCGFTSNGKFEGDICPKCGLTYWKCGKCGYLLTAATPPNVCPSCKEKCDFRNVSCYTPECGGPGKVDPKLL